MNIPNKELIHQKLLEWFQKHHRKLRFRETKNPYHIWVSEVMLQQTRVNTMLVSYGKFIERFPNVVTLANSNLETVLTYWKGLGYYSRAENLHKGAKYILENFQGNIPEDIQKLLQVPGIGTYTANAILSIAYNKPFAVLDGNVKRELSRIFLFSDDITKSKSIKYLQSLADVFLNKENPSDHNQALMELGALVCT
ncbi:MAG: A/G-specific adenine glycosylase, partial [Leptospiraceae bacterium]|nr:A/G-specific adenine glycosylase [Leptospiraceae bacterium]